MKQFVNTWVLVLLALLLVRCSSEDKVEGDSFTPDSGSKAYFTNGMEFTQSQGNKTIAFTTSGAWSASVFGSDTGWCTVTPSSGKGGYTLVTVAAGENTSGLFREAVLTFATGSVKQTVAVSQLGKETPDGISFTPDAPDADSPMTITFKAASSSDLYNYKGDVYVHIGVVSEGTWMYVPAEWNVNTDKCKMTAKGDNVWSITLSPSVREWFKSGETAVNKIGIVIRSASDDKKGLKDDSFITVTDTKYTGFQPAAIKNGSLPAGVQHGINIINGTTVTLVMYDKDTSGNHKDFAHVVGDFNNWKLSNDANSQMFRDETAGCWWITLNGLTAGKEYAFQYYVGTKDGNSFRLGDAYCEKILDPDNDKYISSATYPDNKEYPTGAIGIASVFNTQKDNYSWQIPSFTRPDNDKLIIYEVLLRDFTEAGNIAGLKSQLPYLKSLGVNAIELMPVQEFDGNDSWGYNPCFFFALDKAYGTKRMYKELVDACHANGMAVIFDVVYNHATGNHPFAKLYWDSSKSKTASNNPWFNVDAPHPYSVFHDFNHESPLVKDYVKRNLKFLLEEYNIDGFRFDLTKGFTQKKSSGEPGVSNYDASRIAILKGYNDAVKALKPNVIVILEHFCDITEETELSKADMMLWRNLNKAYCASAAGKSSGSDFTALTTKNTTMAENGWVGYMESHDEPRMAYLQTKDGVGALKTTLSARMKQLATNAAFCFTVPGPKMIWQFGEFGYDVDIEYNGRTGKKPLHWEYLYADYRKDLHAAYSHLLALRDSYPTLFAQSAFKSWNVTETDWAEGRDITFESIDGKKLVVIGNFTNAAITRTVTFPATGTWCNYLNIEEEINVTSPTHQVAIPANEFRLFVKF